MTKCIDELLFMSILNSVKNSPVNLNIFTPNQWELGSSKLFNKHHVFFISRYWSLEASKDLDTSAQGNERYATGRYSGTSVPKYKRTF
jgi:hypothetical protein